ncbi:hypothetical protein Prudu_020593, partial [Prunus dulcis]
TYLYITPIDCNVKLQVLLALLALLPKAMSLTPVMFRSLMRLLTSLIGEPAASVSTLLYYSELLPQNIILERLKSFLLGKSQIYLLMGLPNSNSARCKNDDWAKVGQPRYNL